jgi:hypothetical protein
MSERLTAEMANPRPELFKCPSCGARYKLVRVEAEPTPENSELSCMGCGASLQEREGRFALKYFFTDKSSKRMINRRRASNVSRPSR